MFIYRLTLRNDFGAVVTSRIVPHREYGTFEDARYEAGEVFGLASFVSSLYDNAGTDLNMWLEIVDRDSGAIHWELMAKHAEWMLPTPF